MIIKQNYISACGSQSWSLKIHMKIMCFLMVRNNFVKVVFLKNLLYQNICAFGGKRQRAASLSANGNINLLSANAHDCHGEVTCKNLIQWLKCTCGKLPAIKKLATGKQIWGFISNYCPGIQVMYVFRLRKGSGSFLLLGPIVQRNSIFEVWAQISIPIDLISAGPPKRPNNYLRNLFASTETIHMIVILPSMGNLNL